MEESLRSENESLRKRVTELEGQVASLQTTLDKYKESCRFQLQQLKEYNDSLKEQLRVANDGFMNEKDDSGEIASEEMERFKALVFSPENDNKPFATTNVVSTVHQGNILSIIPWVPNSSYVFSTDVSKRLICFSLDDSSVITEVQLPAPCCSLALICNSMYLLAGCMDGTIHVYHILSDRYIVRGIKKVYDKKIHEKAILRLKSNDTMKQVLSTSYDNTVGVWDISEDAVLSERFRYYFEYTVDGIALAPKHNAVILAERNKPYITYVDLATQHKTEVSINQHDWDLHVSFCIIDITLMSDEKYVVCLTDKSNVIVFPYESNEHVQSLYVSSMFSDSYYVGSIAVDAREQKVLLTCSDNTVRVFSLYSGKEVDILKGHTKLVRNMYYLNDIVPVLFTCSYDHTIRVWKQYYVCYNQTNYRETRFFSSFNITSSTFKGRIVGCASISGTSSL